MSSEVLVTLISSGLLLVGTIITVVTTNRKSVALTNYRIDKLEDKVNKHNNLIERMYAVESEVRVIREELKHE